MRWRPESENWGGKRRVVENRKGVPKLGFPGVASPGILGATVFRLGGENVTAAYRIPFFFSLVRLTLYSIPAPPVITSETSDIWLCAVP